MYIQVQNFSSEAELQMEIMNYENYEL